MYNDTHTLDIETLAANLHQNHHNNFNGKLYYIESYGCQMNFSDSEIVASILQNEGFGNTRNFEEADLIFLNTCSIRDKAEQRIRARLQALNAVKKQRPSTLVGILGCMAERLKNDLLEQERIVDMVVGPDSYRDLPRLVNNADESYRAKKPMPILAPCA